jgi:hypothetical protein
MLSHALQHAERPAESLFRQTFQRIGASAHAIAFSSSLTHNRNRASPAQLSHTTSLARSDEPSSTPMISNRG